MGRKENRVRGFYGTLVSGEKLAVIANQIYGLMYIGTSSCKVSDLLLVTLKDQKESLDERKALICTEGVGWEEQGMGLISVPTNINFGLWNGHVDISVAVIESCATETQVDIADYIRVFGDRLEDNLADWQFAMKKESKKMEATFRG